LILTNHTNPRLDWIESFLLSPRTSILANFATHALVRINGNKLPIMNLDHYT
jgi:hypothetical protein